MLGRFEIIDMKKGEINLVASGSFLKETSSSSVLSPNEPPKAFSSFEYIAGRGYSHYLCVSLGGKGTGSNHEEGI